MVSLEKKLEAILFYKAEPESVTRLSKLLGVSVQEVEEAAHALSAALSDRGIKLLRINDAIELVTTPEVSDILKEIQKEEISRDLGKAGSETLSIILYRGPLTRSQLDYIRGVNSSFILRNLQVRGLVERIPNPNDARSYVYQATPELLKELGIMKLEDLPEYAQVQSDIEAFEKRESENTPPETGDITDQESGDTPKPQVTKI